MKHVTIQVYSEQTKNKATMILPIDLWEECLKSISMSDKVLKIINRELNKPVSKDKKS